MFEKIQDRKRPPFLIAEISANHSGSIQLLKDHMDSAKECGADAIKIQTYAAENMTLNSRHSDFMINHGEWAGHNLYDLYSKAQTPLEWHQEVFDYAKKIEVTLFSTPFDEDTADFLEKFKPEAFKIASFEMTDLDLIEHVAKKSIPLFISTGTSTKDEVTETLEVAQRYLSKDEICLFHCISSYPAPISSANLRTIPDLIANFDTIVGLSDHSVGNTAAIIAIALGARVVEKHFTIDKAILSPDSGFSADPLEFADLRSAIDDSFSAINLEPWSRSDEEHKNKQFRRSLYYRADLKAGDSITRSDIAKIRPGFGMAPHKLKKILGKTLTKDVKFGQRVEEGDFS